MLSFGESMDRVLCRLCSRDMHVRSAWVSLQTFPAFPGSSFRASARRMRSASTLPQKFTHLCAPEGDYVWLDHRLGELFRLDLYSINHGSSTSPAGSLVDSDDDCQPMSLVDSGCTSAITSLARLQVSDRPRIDAATASLASEATENAALRFISSDLSAELNKLTHRRGNDPPFFDHLTQVSEGLANTHPPEFRGKLSIRLVRSLYTHQPYTIFHVDPYNTFPNKKLATTNAIRTFFDTYPEFHSLTL